MGVVANRKAEHLGTTDRGVSLFRRMLGRAIRDTQEGKAPALPRIYAAGKLVRTYVHDVLIRVPPDANLDDPVQLAEFGRRAALIFVETDELPPAEREKVAEERIRQLFEAANIA